MKQLNNIIKRYLTTDTNHAIMIKGKWGTGKTYYYKNIISKEIENTLCFKDNRKKYKSIYISLFGLKSIEEVQTQLILSIYPFFDKSVFKFGTVIAKPLLRGFLHLKGFGLFTPDIDLKSIDKSKFLKLNEIVICFDDLERLSPNLQLEEFIGFVNSIVENENVKIILIANEDIIENKNYHALKDKTISNTIEFLPDTEILLSAIVDERYSDSPIYKDYLKNNIYSLRILVENHSQNLRVLIYALDSFHEVFSKLELAIEESMPLFKFKEMFYISLLRFVVVISIEYKNGKISFLDRKLLDTANPEMHRLLRLSSSERFDNLEKKENKEFWETFVDKYYSNIEYVFYKSVYNFVTGGDVFNVEILIKELKTQHHIHDNEVLRQYEVLQRLNSNNAVLLSNAEYSTLTREMVNFAIHGAYKISEYLLIFNYSIRFDNPLNYKIELLVEKLKKAIRKRSQLREYDPNISYYLEIEDGVEYIEQKKDIIKYIINQNKRIFCKNKAENALTLKKLLIENFEVFKEKTMTMARDNKQEAFLYIIGDYKFYHLFKASTHSRKWEIIELINAYYYNVNPEILKIEFDFFTRLIRRIELKLISPKTKGINAYILKYFKSILDSITNKTKTAANE